MSDMDTQSQVVLISSPGLGHLIPVIELGKGFIIHHNFKVTILAITSNSSQAEARVLNSAATNDHINFIQIPSPDISSFIDAQAAFFTRLCVMMRAAVPAFRHALSNIISTSTHSSTLIVDLFGTECLPLAQEFNMRNKYVFVASHAWFLSLVVYSPYLDKQVKGQYVDQKEPLNIPGCRPVRPEDVVDPMLERNDKQYEEYLTMANEILKGDGVFLNTWECLQPIDLESLRDGDLLGRILKSPVYCIGPLVRQPKSDTSQESESSRVVKWLDKQPSESVIYVSFGSGGTMSSEQMNELAWGLELSGQRFVWVVRAPMEGSADAAFFSTGCSNGSTDEEIASKYLPEGFLSRTNNVGLLVMEWAPQVVILRHPSVGGFLSHCGWNSTLESITNAVPMIAWPLYAEQRINATLLAEELGVAVRPEVLPEKKVVGREEIASLVRKIMVTVENPIRERMKEIKHGAVEALSKGGSSIAALSEVAKTMI